MEKHQHKFDTMKPYYPCECGETLHPMPKEIKHTAIPWKYGKTDLVIRQEKTNHPIADCSYRQISFEENTANAEFIVRAVNAHEDLVNASERAMLFLESENNHGEGKRIDKLSYEVYMDLKQALAKAEGKA
jgi:hypothetical protein